MNKDNFSHLPPQVDINIWDAASILSEWRGDVMTWDKLLKSKGEIRLYEGTHEKTRRHFKLTTSKLVTYENGYSVTAGNDLALFRRLYRITGGINPPDPVTRSLCVETDTNYSAIIMHDGNVFFGTKAEGILIVGKWERYRNTLWLGHTRRSDKRDIKSGFVHIKDTHDSPTKVCKAMRLFHEDPTSEELGLI